MGYLWWEELWFKYWC